MTNPLSSLSNNVYVDPDKCIFCGICVEKCILDNLRMQIASCNHTCPIRLNAHGYIQLIARGKLRQAMELIHEQLPFPGIVGRVCTHPCEDNCERRGVDDEPVAICMLKRFLYDHQKDIQPDLNVSHEKPDQVAIIGSGPAGLMAAWDLRKQGYRVDMLEAASRPGGMLSWAIPEFRLPREVVEHEFSYLEALGVRVYLNTEVGRDVTFQTLYEEHDAILIATGANLSCKLGLEGESAEGVYHGLDFLRLAKENPDMLQVGRKVIVIGGGNAAIDAAQTAMRKGASSVRIVCLEAREQMPAFIGKVDDAVAEGIELTCGWGAFRIVCGNRGVLSVHFKACDSVFDAEGKFNPQLIDDTKCSFDADTVIVAVGQRADPKFLWGSGVQIVDGRIKADPLTQQTSITKVFAAGDGVTGPKSVIEAMAAGRAAAKSIHRLLIGEDIAFGRDYRGPYVTDFEVEMKKASPQSRIKFRRSSTAGFAEQEERISVLQATQEAKRCLNCGLPVGYYRTCWYCLPCEVECPEEALRVDVPYLLR